MTDSVLTNGSQDTDRKSPFQGQSVPNEIIKQSKHDITNIATNCTQNSVSSTGDIKLLIKEPFNDNLTGILGIQNPIQQVDQSLQYMMDQMNKIYISQLESKTQLDSILFKSASKGSFSENAVQEAITKQYPQAIITNTSKTTNACDLMVQLEDIKILIEVKNYSSSIPTKEIEKFLNDVNTTPCDCALFIAFDQRITGKSRISIESTSTCKQVVYLAEQQNYDVILMSLELLCRQMQTCQISIQTMKYQRELARQQISTSIECVKKQKKQTELQLKQLQTSLQDLMLIQQQLNQNSNVQEQ